VASRSLTVGLVGLSGFLYVAIVVGWAVYLVPFALKRYDEATRNRSIDRFSSAMRVLGRRDGEDDGVVARSSTFEMASSRTGTPAVAARRTATREAAKVAARRRRRVLLTLLFLTAATAGAAGLAYVDWWTVGVPGGLVVAWLLACRLQARRERVADARPRERRAEPAPAPAVAESRVETKVEAGRMPVVVAPAADDEPTVVLQREDLDAAAAEYDAGHETQGSLWDPVPVTLPTYVHKPRAPRTIRTIDLGAPGVQSSGHTEEYVASAPVEEPAQPAAHDADEPAPDNGPTRRAVGE
jgi:hypothetical protein